MVFKLVCDTKRNQLYGNATVCELLGDREIGHIHSACTHEVTSHKYDSLEHPSHIQAHEAHVTYAVVQEFIGTRRWTLFFF